MYIIPFKYANNFDVYRILFPKIIESLALVLSPSLTRTQSVVCKYLFACLLRISLNQFHKSKSIECIAMCI